MHFLLKIQNLEDFSGYFIFWLSKKKRVSLKDKTHAFRQVLDFVNYVNLLYSLWRYCLIRLGGYFTRWRCSVPWSKNFLVYNETLVGLTRSANVIIVKRKCIKTVVISTDRKVSKCYVVVVFGSIRVQKEEFSADF